MWREGQYWLALCQLVTCARYRLTYASDDWIPVGLCFVIHPPSPIPAILRSLIDFRYSGPECPNEPFLAPR